MSQTDQAATSIKPAEKVLFEMNDEHIKGMVERLKPDQGTIFLTQTESPMEANERRVRRAWDWLAVEMGFMPGTMEPSPEHPKQKQFFLASPVPVPETVIACPRCHSEELEVERRPNGDAFCKEDHCNWSGPYTECFEGDK